MYAKVVLWRVGGLLFSNVTIDQRKMFQTVFHSLRHCIWKSDRTSLLSWRNVLYYKQLKSHKRYIRGVFYTRTQLQRISGWGHAYWINSKLNLCPQINNPSNPKKPQSMSILITHTEQKKKSSKNKKQKLPQQHSLKSLGAQTLVYHWKWMYIPWESEL